MTSSDLFGQDLPLVLKSPDFGGHLLPQGKVRRVTRYLLSNSKYNLWCNVGWSQHFTGLFRVGYGCGSCLSDKFI